MTEIICPACGSKDLKKIKKNSSSKLTLGDEFQFEEVYYECAACKEEYDLFEETDKNFLKAQKQAEAILIKKIIEELENLNIKMSFFERVFELPIRTLTRWKKGDFSATTVAFLRIIKTYPWIIDVAKNKFNHNYAERAVLRNTNIFCFTISLHEVPQANFENNKSNELLPNNASNILKTTYIPKYIDSR